MADCPNCQQSLSGGVFTAQWEDGDNDYSYITCPHCGYEYIIDDDD